MDRGAWQAIVHGITKSWTQLRTCVLEKGFPDSSVVKNPPASAREARDLGSISGLGTSPREGTDDPLHYSCLGNPMDKGPSAQLLSPVQLVVTPMDCSKPGFPVHHQFLEPAQNYVHWVYNAIQPSHPLESPSPPAFNLAQHQGLFQWVSSLHQEAKVLELQHQSFQWISRTDFL